MANQNRAVPVMSHKSMREFETESDLRTIREARDVMKDKKRMSRVHTLLSKEQKAFDDLQKGLRGREKRNV